MIFDLVGVIPSNKVHIGTSCSSGWDVLLMVFVSKSKVRNGARVMFALSALESFPQPC